jgi:hypothetical protein
MSEIATWSLQRRLEEALRRALPKLGPEARAHVEALINPTSLAIVAGVLIAWVVSHAFGLGQIIDLIIVGSGRSPSEWRSSPGSTAAVRSSILS